MARKAEARIESSDEGRRLVDWLERRFTYLDAAGWERAIEAGRLLVDGERSEAGRVLRTGEIVSFDTGDEPEPEVDSRYEVLHADQDFLVLDKPPLLPCHPGGRFFDNSLSRLLAGRYGWVHIATRLDRETSGLVLACRTRVAAAHIQAESDAGRMRKTYYALVHGEFPSSARAEGFLSRDLESLVRKKRRFTEERPDQPCESCATNFALVHRGANAAGGAFAADGASAAGGVLSLVRCLPETGRSHQIRASLLALGFPILGDKLYGTDEGAFLRFCEGGLTAEDEARLGLPFQALHCGELSFVDREGRSRRYSAPPPSAWPAFARARA